MAIMVTVRRITRVIRVSKAVRAIGAIRAIRLGTAERVNSVRVSIKDL